MARGCRYQRSRRLAQVKKVAASTPVKRTVVTGGKVAPTQVKRTVPVAADFGAAGLTMVRCVAPEPETVYGEVTNVLYDFIKKDTMFVDNRDLAFLLNADYWLDE